METCITKVTATPPSADRRFETGRQKPARRAPAAAPGRQVSDLAFVGLGVSNASSLRHLLTQLVEHPPEQAVSILLIEKHEVHYTGVAYGPRSGPNSLIISTLEDFIDPPERAEFIDWLNANQSWLLKIFGERGGDLSARWIESFRQADRQTLESKICVPRTFYGYFLRERINRLIDTASALGVVKVTSITSEVLDVQRKPWGFALKLADRSSSLAVRKVMLGIGPPAHRRLPRASVKMDETHIIDNPYATNIGQLCRSLSTELPECGGKRRGRRASLNVLMVGANASAIEACYLLFDQKALRRLIKRVVVVSPSGSFPDRRPVAWSRAQLDYRPVCLEELAASDNITAREIYLAFMADLNQWRSLDASGSYPVVALGKEVVDCVQKLSRAQKIRFTNRYGILIGKHQRRAGDEYLDFAADAVCSKRLRHVKGRFGEVLSHDGEGYRVSLTTPGATRATPMKNRFHLIVNCMGPTTLHETQAPLIAQLLKRGLCQVNESGRGFRVRDDYSASDGLIVTGPLISGNVIDRQAVWHVEHCGRLTAIGKVIGKQLYDSLVYTGREMTAA